MGCRAAPRAQRRRCSSSRRRTLGPTTSHRRSRGAPRSVRQSTSPTPTRSANASQAETRGSGIRWSTRASWAGSRQGRWTGVTKSGGTCSPRRRGLRAWIGSLRTSRLTARGGGGTTSGVRARYPGSLASAGRRARSEACYLTGRSTTSRRRWHSVVPQNCSSLPTTSRRRTGVGVPRTEAEQSRLDVRGPAPRVRGGRRPPLVGPYG
mmetsp:Transcript_11919/g.26809  ORF Transcript_11919/g.26809 Transcript_11919/m.26809 type:complete len:208 (+) Transcript_11919:400-1023(+)